ncbi:MJ1255/VC2487 family glycosyltransferase [Adhaeribacter soli]|uniref:UDP-glucuronosyltransferase n=1 Tax=Adhaeribacter soli TaxID=2607655 RepID=A0A5N1J845_9BACT|nr:MJ1255/VC2487 family glycosyltransferase [Adhaeribacter soli]KAA9340841.1 UDP-glucuronosyltransferase [Adhaeribacter soli]
MKILYGVPGEGLGHATRSQVIIRHLLQQNHQVQVVSSSRAFELLNHSFPGCVHEIKGFHLAYNNAAVSKLKTFTNNLKSAPENLRVNFNKYRKIQEEFEPELVISDFESFSYFYAKYHKLPIISIDNMQIMSRGRLDIKIPEEQKKNFQIGKNIVRAKVPRCQHYLITSFFPAFLAKDRTTVVPPIMREAILKAQPSNGPHVLVYQSSTSQKNLISTLQELPLETFRVYGFNKSETHGNVQLKAFSEQGFIDDLASAKAVLTNGGFSLISEAIYLHKPICSIPLENQFEQFMNAAYLQKLGYGRHFDTITPDNLRAFLYDVNNYKLNLQGYHQNGNLELFRALDTLLPTLHC